MALTRMTRSCPQLITARMITARSVWRTFDHSNSTVVNGAAYVVETLLHELLLQSEHRTFDPDEAGVDCI